MKWDMKSKRFVMALAVMAVWVVALITNVELFKWLTPYALGTIGLWMGWDTLRKSE